MNLHNSIPGRMEYIQKLFLSVQDYTQKNYGLERLIAFLNAESPEFRSVGYEAASMELAFQDLSSGTELNNWKKFYDHAASAHAFHMDIGLGWAFAKSEMSPTAFLKTLQVTSRMVFDGMG